MKSEADQILDKLPRWLNADDAIQHRPNAKVYVDASGRLCILTNTDGLLMIDEKQLGYVKGDVDPLLPYRD